MKNHQKGFSIPLLIAIIAILAIGSGAYVYENKKIESPTTAAVGGVQEQDSKTLTIEQISNLSYGYPSSPQQFLNGQYVYAYVGTNGVSQPNDKTVIRIDEKLVIYGDLNGDGLSDAIVPISSEPLKNGVPDESLKTENKFYVVINKDGKPVPIPSAADVAYDSGSCGLYGGLVFQSINIDNGEIIVDVLSRRQCDAKTAVAKKVIYEIKNNQLILVSIK